MAPNADLDSRMELRLFRSYFDFNLSGHFTQGRSGIGLIWLPSGKFQQVNGLGSGGFLLVAVWLPGEPESTRPLLKDLNGSLTVLTLDGPALADALIQCRLKTRPSCLG